MLTGLLVQPRSNTRLLSRAKVVAELPAVQRPSAFTQHARGRRLAAIVAAGGCWSPPGAGENAWKEIMP